MCPTLENWSQYEARLHRFQSQQMKWKTNLIKIDIYLCLRWFFSVELFDTTTLSSLFVCYLIFHSTILFTIAGCCASVRRWKITNKKSEKNSLKCNFIHPHKFFFFLMHLKRQQKRNNSVSVCIEYSQAVCSTCFTINGIHAV